MEYIDCTNGSNGDLPTELTKKDSEKAAYLLNDHFEPVCFENETGQKLKNVIYFIKCCSALYGDIEAIKQFASTTIMEDYYSLPRSQFGILGLFKVFVSKNTILHPDLSAKGKPIYVVPCCVTEDETITKDVKILKTVYLKTTRNL